MPSLERPALVGMLRGQAEAAVTAGGRLLLVAGEAGAGKTTLVRRAFPDALWGHCEPLTTPRPLGPFRDIAAQLVPPIPLRGNAFPNRLLAAMGPPRPVWVVEDAHWLDTASADVLRFLGRRIASTAALLVVVARDGQPADDVVNRVLGELGAAPPRIAVPALTRAEVGQLTVGTDRDVDEVLRLTDGNAFLVGQLIESREAVATTVRDAIVARLAVLSPAARELAQLLAVIPGRVGTEVLAGSWPAADELLTAGVLVPDDASVRFRHELLRLVVEDTVAPGRRRELHGFVLGRLLPGAEPAQVAHHARLAGRFDLALPSEVEAAVRAAAFGSHREAAAHYRRAVQDARPSAAPAELARMLLRLAEYERTVAHDAAARNAVAEALSLGAAVADPLLRSGALLLQSRLDPSEAAANEAARAAVALCEGAGPSIELATAYATLAHHRMLARDLAEARVQALRAQDLAEELGSVQAQVLAADALGSALLLDGDRSGEAPLRRAIHLAAAHGLDPEVGRAYANLVSAAGEARMYELSASAGREAFRYFTARDLDASAAYTRAWTARCLFEQGQWDGADRELALLRANPGTTSAITDLMTDYLTVRLIARRGTGTVAGPLARAQAIADVTGSLQRVAPVAAARAEAGWQAGRPLDVAALQAAYGLALARDNPWTIGELGFWLWRAGQLAVLPAAAAAPFRLHVAGAHEAAADAWSTLGCRYEMADALADSGSEPLLLRAVHIFGDLGAAPARQRAARRLRQLGVRAVPRGPRPDSAADPAGLTAREREVLDLLGRGHTDREIAARLSLSVRTAGHHVAAILRKTGAGSRRDLRRSGD